MSEQLENLVEEETLPQEVETSEAVEGETLTTEEPVEGESPETEETVEGETLETEESVEGEEPETELPDDTETIDPPAEEEPLPIPPSVDGVFPSEVAARLSHNLYEQLSDGSEDFVLEALKRARIELGTVLEWLAVQVNLDVPAQREALLNLAIYHLHLALGHEDEGAEFRNMAKVLISNAYGSYPSNSEGSNNSATAGVVVSPPSSPRSTASWRARMMSL